MKDRLNTIKRLRPATLIALLALFIAVGGTATAASNLINGKNIKKGTVTAKQIKNKTITTGKLAPATVNSLKGAKGATGEQGAQGVQGVPGTPGADGIVQPIETTLGGHSIAADENYNLLNIDVPTGAYLVSAKVGLQSDGTDDMTCRLFAGNGAIEIDESTASSEGDGTIANVVAQGVTNGSTTKIRFNCTTGSDSGRGDDVSVIATPIG